MVNCILAFAIVAGYQALGSQELWAQSGAKSSCTTSKAPYGVTHLQYTLAGLAYFSMSDLGSGLQVKPMPEHKNALEWLFDMKGACEILKDLPNLFSTKAAGGFPLRREIAVGRFPIDMVLADFNGDGLEDLAVVNQDSDDVSIVPATAPLSYGVATNVTVGKAPVKILAADLNNDGKIDLVTANQGRSASDGSLSLLLGKGDGSFQAAINLDPGAGAASVAIGDFNKDGRLDLVRPGLNRTTVSVLLGNGDATFQAPVLVEAGGSDKVAAGDLNRDGNPDIIVSIFDALSILLGNGNGSFQPARQVPVLPRNSTATIETGDLNRDGNLDLVTANYLSASISVLLGKGDGTFRTPQHYVVSDYPLRISVIDVDGDQILDLHVNNFNADHDSILLNNGDGTFLAGRAFLTADRDGGTSQVDVADFNNDGYPDLAASNNLANSAILLGEKGRVFQQRIDLGREGILAIADFNRDGNADVAGNRRNDSQGFIRPNVFVLLGNGAGGFTQSQQILIGNNSFEIGPMMALSVNNDELPDLVLLDTRSNAGVVYLGNGDGTFQAGLPFQTAEQSLTLTAGDLNRDGRTDLAIASIGTPGSINGSLAVMLGNGDGTFRAAVNVLSGAAVRRLALGDVDHDGILDLAAAIENPQFTYNFAFLAGNGDGTFRAAANLPATLYRFSGVGSTAIVDFDGDGFRDILVASTGEGALILFPGNGDGSFQSPRNFDAGTGFGSMAIADLDLDRKPDVAIPNGRNSTLTILFNLSGRPVTNTNLAAGSGGVAGLITPGDSNPIQVGYATATPVFGIASYATAAFSLMQNGVVVSEAGVPASPPTRSARIFIDYRTQVSLPGLLGAGTVEINTGIAIVNLGSATAHLAFRLRDSAGTTLANGNGTLDAGAHIARFIDQLNQIAPNFALPAGFPATIRFGSLEISSDQPISILALRLTVNQRGETLLTTIPIADLMQADSGGTIYFPQLVNGGGYATTVILINTTGATETGTLQVTDDGGNPLPVGAVGGTTASSINYSIPPAGVFILQTDGAPQAAAIGWVRVAPNAGTTTPAGAGIFQLSTGGILVMEAGVPSSMPTTRARIFVDKSGAHDTGLAIGNPGGAGGTITMKAFELNGSTPAGTGDGTLLLNGNGHKAEFVGQRIPGLPPGFRGVARDFLRHAVRGAHAPLSA